MEISVIFIFFWISVYGWCTSLLITPNRCIYKSQKGKTSWENLHFFFLTPELGCAHRLPSLKKFTCTRLLRRDLPVTLYCCTISCKPGIERQGVIFQIFSYFQWSLHVSHISKVLIHITDFQCHTEGVTSDQKKKFSVWNNNINK